MAVMRNGKPIDESEHEYADRDRKEAMQMYRLRNGWGGQAGSSMQGCSHYAADTPRNWKHNRNLRA